MAMDMSLQDYYNRIVWLDLSVVILYLIIKYVAILFYIGYQFVQLVKRYKHKCEKSNTCNNEPSPQARVELEAIEEPEAREEPEVEQEKPLPCLLLLVFGKQMGTKDATNKHKIHIKDVKCSPRWWQETVLCIVICGSVLLALGSALDLTLFSTTHVCTEDPYIDCFPQLIAEADDTSMNITVDVSIQDCTYWNSVGVSERVTFVCFQRYFSLELFLGIAGGLLAFALFALKTMIGFLFWLTQMSMKVSKSTCCTYDTKKKKNNSTYCTYVITFIRALLIFFSLLTEAVFVVLHLVLGVTKVSADGISDPPETLFFTMHSTEILVVIGTTATLLWLPWEQYVNKQ